MKIYKLSLGELQANCYIIATENGNAIVVDPGDESDKILRLTADNSLKITKILLTHGHFDHVNGVAELVEKSSADVFVHDEDSSMLTDRILSLAYFLPDLIFNKIDKFIAIKDGDVISQDELNFKVISTPGHTNGCVCFICENIIFSGDTLFAGSIGRTDFPSGNISLMKKSLSKLSNMDGNFKILSGHGEDTDLDTERATNIYLKENNYDINF